MDGIVKIRGGSYWDYWFTEDGIVRVNLVSQTVLLVALLLMLTLTVLLSVLGALLGLLAVLVVYWRIGSVARKRRALLEEKSAGDISNSKMVDLRIPYSDVTRADLEPGKLTLLSGRRRIRIKILPVELEQLRTLLQSKLGEKLSVTPSP